MGLFSNSYTKSGPGVNPDAPQKRSFFRFFDIFSRKFWHFSKANLIYSLALIPTFVIILLISFFMVSVITSNVSFAEAGTTGTALVYWLGGLILTNLYISLWGAGPATAGMTYLMRNFANEDHAWLWSDFKDNVKTNFKQALAVFAVDIGVIVFSYIAICVYSQMPGFLGMLKYAVYLMLFIYTMMHLYIYPMMVTFKLSLKDLYKNSLLFALGKLPSNLLIIAILVGLHVIIPAYVTLMGGQYSIIILIVLLLLEILISQAFSAFLVNFNAYPKIKRYMLDSIPNNDLTETSDKGENNNAGENS